MKLIIKTNNPYDYNSVVASQMEKREEQNMRYTPTAEQVLMNPTCNYIAKLLGIDTKHDWNTYSDKVQRIYEYLLKQNNGKDVLPELVKHLNDKMNNVPEFNGKRIVDLDLAIRLEDRFGTDKTEPVKADKKEEPKEEVENKESEEVK